MLLPGMQSPQRVTMPSMPARVATLPVQIVSDFVNYPNPFASRRPGLEGKTAIAYQLNQPGHASLTIYDLLGNRVRTWEFNPGDNGARQGSNQLVWDGTNEAGQKVSKG